MQALTLLIATVIALTALAIDLAYLALDHSCDISWRVADVDHVALHAG